MTSSAPSRRPAVVRALLAALWTAGLAGAFLATDRLLVERAPEGWVAVAHPEEVPAAAGPVLVPLYLPARLAWPPDQVLWRDEGQPGWWLGLAWRPEQAPKTDERGPGLWLGTGLPAPEALGPASGCLGPPPSAGCPTGWHHLSTQIEGGRTVHVVGALPPLQIARILEGLHRAGAPGAGPEGRIRR